MLTNPRRLSPDGPNQPDDFPALAVPRTGTISALYGMIVAQARLPFLRDYTVADALTGVSAVVLHLALCSTG